MTLRPFRACLLAAVAGITLPVVAQTPPTSPSPAPAGQRAAGQSEDPVISLRLPDAPLELVLQQVEKFTGRTILRPQTLPTPTISISATLPQSEMLLALETLLNMNGIGLVRMDDKFIKVVALQMARTEAPQMIDGSTLGMKSSGQIAAKVFQLEFLRVGEILPQLTPLLNPNLGGPVVFEKANAALITDSITTLQRIETLLQKLDQPTLAGLKPKFYNVRFAKASDLVSKMRAMMQGPLQAQIGSATSYSADDRTNQIVLITDPRQYPFFDDLIAKLDVKSDPNTRNEVIYLKHATAKNVATLLTQLVSGQTKAAQSTNSVVPGQTVQPAPAQGGQPASAQASAALGDLAGSAQFSSLATIFPDDRSNAVVVNGTVDDIRLIRELIDKVDVMLAQVRIEVVVAEVSLTNASSTGISSLGLVVQGQKLVGIAGTAAGVGVGGVPSDSTATTGSGFAVPSGDMSLTGVVSLSTTPRKDYSSILSTPTITTMHNTEAKIFFGETRPVVTGSLRSGSSSSDSGLSTSSTIQEKEIGTLLTVKPLIGNDGVVELDIKQTISDVTGTVKVDGNDQYVIGKRETNSFLTVKSGEIIVLGGIQKENNTRTTTRLGPIPIIGDLLGARSKSKIRKELVVFIRPHVLDNTPADNVPALNAIDTMPHAEDINKVLAPIPQERTTDALKRSKVGPPQKN